MRVSSTTRSEAKTLFWPNKEAVYRIDGEWLLAGGFTGHTCSAVDFLRDVQQVEVHFRSTSSLLYKWSDIKPKVRLEDETPDSVLDDRIESIWRLLVKMCPRVTHVVISGSYCRHPAEPLTNTHARLLEKSPANLTSSGFYLHHKALDRRGSRRCLCKKTHAHDSSAGYAWTVVDPQWKREIVLLPPKTFRCPVGKFQQTEHELMRSLYQHWSLSLLRIEAIENHFFGGKPRPVACPEAACEVYFESPGQWPVHAEEYKHYSDAAIPPELAVENSAQQSHIKARLEMSR